MKPNYFMVAFCRREDMVAKKGKITIFVESPARVVMIMSSLESDFIDSQFMLEIVVKD